MRMLLRLIAQCALIFGCLFTVANFVIAKGGHGGGGGHHGGGHHGGHHGGGHHDGHHGGGHHDGHHGGHGYHRGGWWGWGVGVPVGYYAGYYSGSGTTTYIYDETPVVYQQPVEDLNILISINPAFAQANPSWANAMAANIDRTEGVKYVQGIEGQNFAANPGMDLFMLWPRYNDVGVSYKVFISHDNNTKILIGETPEVTMYIPASKLVSNAPNVIWVEVYDGSGNLVGSSTKIEL